MPGNFFKLAFTAVTLVLPAVDALWPLPTDLSTGANALKLSSSFDIKYNAEYAPADLKAAIERTKKYLSEDKLGRLVVGRGADNASAISSAPSLASLSVELNDANTVNSIAAESVKALGNRSESYTLTVPSDGSAATLKADSTLGLFRGLTTFGQLWYDLDGTTYTIEAPIDITDSPAYPYRGFMLDTARNYFPVSDIKRTLDAMSIVKMSTFHWHIVDSQSFPLVLSAFPEISEKGAYSAKQVYTEQDVKDVVTYAAERGIDVIAEIDTPGHTSVISKSHPEHIACPEAAPWASYAAEPPAGQLRIASPDTIKFTSDLLSSASKLFSSSYFSTGGDEVNAKCYTDDEETQASLGSSNKTFEEALSDFTVSTHKALKEVGKTAVVWEEMVLDHTVELANDTVILVWISSANAVNVTEKGFNLIHAASDYFYLDCGHGGWVGAAPQLNSWCDPFKTWQKAYSFNPTANMTEAQAKLVLGGQHLLWTEQTSPASLDSTVWPRAAASAEVFWSGSGGDVRAALPRLHDIAYRMQQRGIGAIALQPLWCALRPSACDLDA